MKIIHTQIVTEYTKLLPENKLLGQQAPEIHHSEELLPRKTRCTLSQLRTNKFIALPPVLQTQNKSHTLPITTLPTLQK